MVRRLLKKILVLIGYDPHVFLFKIFERNAKGIYEKKLLNLDRETRILVEQEDEKHHLVDMEFSDAGSQYVVRSFTIDRIRFMRECGVQRAKTVLDLGDSNGIFIRSLNREGISVNISDPTIHSLKSKQLEVVKADVEWLPFQKKSVSAILLFETLEHVPNPIRLLSEINQICKGSLILSIPLVSETHIHPYNYDPSRPIYQHHIFEFSPEDFKKIITHTGFTIDSERIVTVVGTSERILDSLIFFIWRKFIEPDTYCGCFRQFYMCHLKTTLSKEMHPPNR